MNTQKFKNDQGKFPLTTDSLDFIQEQIKLVYGLTNLAGQFVIIREPSGIIPGLVIVNGELLPLTGSKSNKTTKIIVSQIDKTITVGDGTEFSGNVRSERIATYLDDTRAIGGVIGGTGGISLGSRVGFAGTGEYALSKFIVLKDIQTLMNELEDAKKHHMPKGTIIDWYTDKAGGCCFDNIPDGFVPCGRYMKCSSMDWATQTNGKAIAEVHKFEARYGKIEYEGGGSSFVRIKKVDTMIIPDLTDRFIVQAGGTYNQGDTGGEDKHKLTISEMPSHNHSYSSYPIVSDDIRNSGSSENEHIYRGNASTKYTNYSGSGYAHENRPPYFALYKLIKVI